MQQEYILENSQISIVEDEAGPSNASFRSMRQPEASDYAPPPGMPQDGFNHTMAHLQPDESILQWFDKAVEEELARHRRNANMYGQTMEATQGLGHSSMAGAAASGVEIMGELEATANSELREAVENLAKAEAVIAYEGAVRAAELAASQVAPEFAEEAAAAGARDYQAELTGVLRQEATADRPIEVIGYVGVTKPRYPMRSKHTNNN